MPSSRDWSSPAARAWIWSATACRMEAPLSSYPPRRSHATAVYRQLLSAGTTTRCRDIVAPLCACALSTCSGESPPLSARCVPHMAHSEVDGPFSKVQAGQDHSVDGGWELGIGTLVLVGVGMGGTGCVVWPLAAAGGWWFSAESAGKSSTWLGVAPAASESVTALPFETPQETKDAVGVISRDLGGKPDCALRLARAGSAGSFSDTAACAASHVASRGRVVTTELLPYRNFSLSDMAQSLKFK